MEELVELLQKHKYTISMAESCTGGLLAACIVSVADASKVFNQSFVTYTIEAKMKYAHVKKETIDKYSVVSEEVALEMAKGVKLESNSNVGIGITGYAGPSGDNVGLVCFGLVINDNEYVYEMWFNGTRNEIRAEAVEFIVRKTIEKLKEIS
ncbi:MAG: CinA family protein [bacterium]|nr:CinA family protein [bacterium]